MVKCSCGSEEIHYDSGRGERTCGNCGQVLEENAIVAEVVYCLWFLLFNVNYRLRSIIQQSSENLVTSQEITRRSSSVRIFANS